jgi:hypothetical protein
MEKVYKKESIIGSMCMTYDHRYGMSTYINGADEALDKFNLSRIEREGIYRQMKQIFENDIEPILIQECKNYEGYKNS